MSFVANTLRSILIAGFGVVLSVASGFAADTTISVDLWDKGADMEMLKGMGMAMSTAATDMSMLPMGITLSVSSVPAGNVTFNATNTSKETIHEMVVAPVSDISQPMAYDEANEKVDEDAAGHLGEVAELDPGASGSLTLTLKPGTYILYCNLPGHYASGMWALLTVN